ncbi:transporter associated domain-containing protein [Saccharomonospora piscinae]|uniref:Transporter-associated domain-containing protein n=1 Tax=Saccharomonospora piscinae TaxID=687388 RepID=A0A1V8ZXB6_SACPI|nr:hypothetical protein B1813_21700 [Saccharomonospora piscinae]
MNAAEELVGEITDEHDEGPALALVRESVDTWRMDGDVHVDEVGRALERPMPEGDFETFAGLLIAERGALPEPGERVRVPLPDDPAVTSVENGSAASSQGRVRPLWPHPVKEGQDDDQEDGPRRCCCRRPRVG